MFMNQTKIIVTEDQSTSLYNTELNESYHSQFGALAESKLIFIEYGLQHLLMNPQESVHILEYGFGTGLNALLTLAFGKQLKINYEAIELYPLALEIAMKLNYTSFAELDEFSDNFEKLHAVNWNERTQISPCFSFLKHLKDFKDFHPEPESIDLIYFDAFSPDKQPELWTELIFFSAYESLKTNGILVTYSAKGIVKEALRNVGFRIERLSGPKGKRHVLRARK